MTTTQSTNNRENGENSLLLNSLKYTTLSAISTKKDYIEAFFDLGLYIHPYHGVDPVSGDCSCKDEECNYPGKHPALPNKAGFYCIEKYLEWLSNNPECCTIGIATGYYKKFQKSLVVIDIDDMVHLETMKNLVPSMNNTFSVKTRKGMHFYFWAEGKVDSKTEKNSAWVNTKIRADGMAVDILAQKHAGVVAPGSMNKAISSNLPIATLSYSEVETLNNMKGGKKNYSPKSKTSKEDCAEVKAFYGREVEHGQYNSVLVMVSSKQLRRQGSAVVSGTYTLADHVTWLTNEATAYLPAPLNLKKVKQVAQSMFKSFDPTKGKARTQSEIFNEVFQNVSCTYSLSVLKNILVDTFKVDQDPKFAGSTLVDIRNEVVKQLKLAETQPLYFTDKQLVIFLSEFHPDMKKKRLDKIIQGKRVQTVLWNLEFVTT